MKPKAKQPDAGKLMQRMASLCARSEQCSHDILMKLLRAGLAMDEASEIIDTLRSGKFIDDSRYAKAFVRDKVRFAGWGRLKIRQSLILKRIPSDTVQSALAEISADDYKAALSRATFAKARTLDLDGPSARDKMLRHLTSRGFEPALAVKAWEVIIKRHHDR